MPLARRFNWLFAFWLLAAGWTVYFCHDLLTTSTLYALGPLLALGIWLIPLLPLIAVTWVRRISRLSGFWRWAPPASLLLVLVVAAVPFRLPREHFTSTSSHTEVFWNTWFGVIGSLVTPLLLTALFLVVAFDPYDSREATPAPLTPPTSEA